jgi:hypothetical protein
LLSSPFGVPGEPIHKCRRRQIRSTFPARFPYRTSHSVRAFPRCSQWATATPATALTSKKADIAKAGKLFPLGQLKADNVIYLITGRQGDFRAVGSEAAGGRSLRLKAGQRYAFVVRGMAVC